MSEDSEKEENERIMKKELIVLSWSRKIYMQDLVKQLKNIHDESNAELITMFEKDKPKTIIDYASKIIYFI